MKIYYLQNENGEIVQDDFYKFNDDCLEKELDDYHIQNGYNGANFLAEYMATDEYKAKAAAFGATKQINSLRREREKECFAIINRGAIWYERLTEAQIEELRGWYSAWLDVTITLKRPEKPSWLI